jgi:Type IV secretion system pilin
MPPRRTRRLAARCGVVALTLLSTIFFASAAYAAGADSPVLLAVNDLATVITNLQAWIIGLLAAVATLFLVIGFARYMTAGGDPSEIERAKGALKAAAVGYAGALLAPVLMTALKGILGV